MLSFWFGGLLKENAVENCLYAFMEIVDSVFEKMPLMIDPFLEILQTCMFNTYALFSNIWEKWCVGWIGCGYKSLTTRMEMTFAMIQ